MAKSSAKDSNSAHRIVALHQSLEAWYVSHVKPLLVCNTQSDTSTGRSVNPDILLSSLDAVSNSALAMLEKWYTILAGASDSAICSTAPAPATANRQAAARGSLDVVRRHAPLAAKPLEFGLGQLAAVVSGDLYMGPSRRVERSE